MGSACQREPRCSRPGSGPSAVQSRRPCTGKPLEHAVWKADPSPGGDQAGPLLLPPAPDAGWNDDHESWLRTKGKAPPLGSTALEGGWVLGYDELEGTSGPTFPRLGSFSTRVAHQPGNLGPKALLRPHLSF